MNTRKFINLNNHAVTFLQEGRHKEAIDLLRTAITELGDNAIVRNFSSEPGLPDPSVTMPDASSSAPLVSTNEKDADEHSSHIKADQQAQAKASICSVPLWTAEESSPRQDETSIFMYSEALVLVHTDHSCNELIIGVILYNMALANHTRAIETNTSNPLTLALKLYGMALAVTQCRKGGTYGSDYWLLLALYSNMAQIYLSRACSDKLSQCLGNTRTLLAAIRAEQAVDVDAYAFFFANAMLELRVVAAPAA
jgi:hypothetical protein